MHNSATRMLYEQKTGVVEGQLLHTLSLLSQMPAVSPFLVWKCVTRKVVAIKSHENKMHVRINHTQ